MEGSLPPAVGEGEGAVAVWLRQGQGLGGNGLISGCCKFIYIYISSGRLGGGVHSISGCCTFFTLSNIIYMRPQLLEWTTSTSLFFF